MAVGGMITARCGACAAALLLAQPASGGAQLEPRLRITAEARYDGDGAALPLDSGRGQLMSKLMPQAGLSLSGPTFRVRSWYSPDLLFRHGSGTFSVDHRGSLTLRKTLSDRAWMDGGLRLWRVSDPTSLPRLGLAQALAPVLYGRGEVSSHLRVTDRWTAGLGYALEGTFVEDGGADAGWMHAPYADAWYRLSRRTDLGLEYRLQYFTLGPEDTLAHAFTGALRHRFTRQIYALLRAGPGFYGIPGEWTWWPFPRASLEIGRDGEHVDFSLTAGHDLVGASGFAPALWADYASARIEWRVAAPVRLYAAASYHRNGRAPDLTWTPFGGVHGSEGYAVGGGMEWRLRRGLSVQLGADRYSQIGLTRNAVAVRVVAVPFQAGPDTDW